MDTTLFKRFAPIIRSLSDAELKGSPSLMEKMLLSRDSNLTICYAPLEYINTSAKIVIVGITPGQTQMINAIKEARRQLDRGTDDSTVLHAAKQIGAFSGTMRPNLVALLDRIGVQQWLGLRSCDELFGGGSASHLVQTASVLRNPVFLDGNNYNGTPNMTRQPMLRDSLMSHFGQDACLFPNAVFIPLGDRVSDALGYLADQGRLDRSRILDGLPHPSGANAERIAYFLGKKEKGALSAKTDPSKLDSARKVLLE
ncbi:MAG: hypothetical protein WCG75_09680, partial [Armatimonadota bacterium]